jgi:hypothetical protein
MPGPQTWKLILAQETGNLNASFSMSSTPWSATNVGELVNATERRFSFKLNQPQTISFNIPLTDPLADDIATLTNDATSIPIIKLYRSTTLMMVAEIVSAEIVGEAGRHTLAVVATETMWNRLNKRIIPDSKKPIGYRVASTADRTSEMMTQLTNINRESYNMLPAYSIGSEFTDTATNLANWSLVSLLWGGGASALARSTAWTGHTGGSLLLSGTKDATATQRYLLASTPGTGANMIPVTPGTVYALKLNCAASSVANQTASGGVYLQINWFQNNTGTASAIIGASSQTAQTVTTTESTLSSTAAAPSDAQYAQISFVITTSTSTDAVGYYFDDVNFGPAPQTGILPGTATGWTGDIFAGGPWYYKQFLEYIQELAFTNGGFDFWQAPLDPVANNGNSGTLTVKVLSPGGPWSSNKSFRGQTRADAVFEYGTGKNNVVDYRFTLSGDGLINTAYALPPGFPSGGAGTTSKADSTGTSRQRLREEVVSSDLQTADARQYLVNEHVKVRQRYKRVLTFTPQVEDGTRTPRFAVDYEIGDNVTARIKDQNVLLINTTVRVYGADIEVDDNGFVRTTLSLVQEV